MAAATKAPTAGLARLREPFAENEMGLLPKVIDKTSQKAQCRQGTNASADGHFCGGYHQRSIHLTYVGHAAITKRLLEVDEDWEWAPMGIHPETGMPLLDGNGGLWIKLTVLGKTKLGYGDAEGKSGPSAVKEAIGDALRNAGMRFGMALDLWHKGDLYANEVEQGKLETDADEPPTAAAESKSAAKVEKKMDWLLEAQKKDTADEILEVWRNAKRGGANAADLKTISTWGSEKRAEEEAKEAAAIDPETDPVVDPTEAEAAAAEKMKGAFGGNQEA